MRRVVGPLFIFALVMVGPLTNATIGVEPTRLPSPRTGTAAAWDGQRAWVFGGQNGVGREVVSYNPRTDQLTQATLLPTEGIHRTAVWTGRYVFLFGGSPFEETSDSVLRFDPVSNTVVPMTSHLPTPREAMSGVWSGDTIYLFGGNTGASFTLLDDIVAYHPSSDTLEVLHARLPTPRTRTSAVWDGQAAYIFGGLDASGARDEILRFDPSAQTVGALSFTLPSARWATSAAWDGCEALVFGGETGFPGPKTDEIVAITPLASQVFISGDRLPTPRAETSAVWTGREALVFGGRDGAFYDDIVQFVPGNPPSACTPIPIDIKPGSYPNSISRSSRGNIPVAILSTPGFDALARVDSTSLTFGQAGSETSLRNCNRHGEDVNGDGLADLVCHFVTQRTGFRLGDVTGTLRGKIVGGQPFAGMDSVRILP